MLSRVIVRNALSASLLGIALTACTNEVPTSLRSTESLHRDADAQAFSAPTYDIDVHLQNDGRGAGFIKFRQPDDGVMRIFLETKVEGLAPNHDYYLQRAATTLGSGCVDAGWLTLGLGTVVTPIHTNNGGVGRATLYRDLPSAFAGLSFDIHFQIVDVLTGAVELQSECLAYTANPN